MKFQAGVKSSTEMQKNAVLVNTVLGSTCDISYDITSSSDFTDVKEARELVVIPSSTSYIGLQVGSLQILQRNTCARLIVTFAHLGMPLRAA